MTFDEQLGRIIGLKRRRNGFDLGFFAGFDDRTIELEMDGLSGESFAVLVIIGGIKDSCFATAGGYGSVTAFKAARTGVIVLRNRSGTVTGQFGERGGLFATAASSRREHGTGKQQIEQLS